MPQPTLPSPPSPPSPAASPPSAAAEAALEAALSALARGEHGDPFAVLGPHACPGGALIRVVMPGALAVEVLPAGGEKETGTALAAGQGGVVFSGIVAGLKAPWTYRLKVTWPDAVQVLDDPYRFPPLLGELDIHLFSEGNHLRAWERLGAHPAQVEGVIGVTFAVWAPDARRVSVVGDFCGWDGRRLPMRKRHECGIWELFVPGLEPGVSYKFEILGPGYVLQPLKADPLAQAAELPPRTASIVCGPPLHDWADTDWMANRSRSNGRDAPVSIYEVHLGSWRRVPEEGNRYLTYRELAEHLVPYAARMGFTHLELMPITEHPFDGSWGYQPTGLYAPTSRHGTPDDFRYFIDACHQAGLGVLLDWVPGHFPTDAHGLARFDGTHLYEHADPRQGYHPDWNTLIYNFGRREVTNFLMGSALCWLERFHLDGLRVDAVASMLYLDYSRADGEWVPNRYGGRENLEAIAFLRKLNESTYGQHPGIMTVAEESTAWPGVSRPTWLGGLGFGYKWNMGWMHDILRYFGRDPVHRRFHHNDLTFALLYQYSENYILPLSHDEVVHGKGSLLGKMPGDRWQQFANLRALYGQMFCHPGKKLLFQGCEFAQEREWNHDASLDWHLLTDPLHAGIQALVRDLNHLYRTHPALHALECEPAGFSWIEANDAEHSTVAFLRRAPDGKELICIGNFTPIPRTGWRVGVSQPGWYAERLNTDAACYGGSGLGNQGGVGSEEVPWHGQPHSLLLTLPPLSMLVLEREG